MQQLTKLLEEKNYQQLIQEIGQLVGKDPKNASYWKLGGQAYFGLNNWEKAQQALTTATQLGANDAHTLELLAQACFYNKDDYTRLQVYSELMRLNPQQPRYYVETAKTLSILGQGGAAIRVMEHANKVAPNDPEVIMQTAAVYNPSPDKEKRESSFEKVFALYPDYVPMLYDYTVHRKNTLEDPHVAKLQEAFDRGPDNQQRPVDYMLASFALGHIYFDVKEPNKALDYFEIGNSYRCDEQMKKRILAERDKSKAADFALFGKPMIDGLKGAGDPDATPIFIVGMPRSGTTLTERILGAHSKVFGAGELQAIPYIRNYILPRQCVQNGTLRITPDHVKHMAQFYLQVSRSEAEQAAYVVDKMPNNYKYLGLIYILFPNAKIIHCTRDPMDTCWSIYRNYFPGGHYHGGDQTLLAEQYNIYRDQMKEWQAILPEGWIYESNYEALIADPETQVRKLLDFVGLEWEEQCLSFHKQKQTVHTASSAQVREPINKNSLKSWSPIADRLTVMQEILDSYEN